MSSSEQDDEFAQLRREMVARRLRARGISDQRVLDAMLRVPRHEFVPEAYREQSYDDHPIPISAGQTISQPYIVASMLQALELKGDEKVLEVGAGSGYVTALLAELSRQVISIERHEVLASGARERLAGLGYSNLKILLGDGTLGYAPVAPYDAMVVSAAAPELPPALASQLAEGGRMIIPVGGEDTQQLQLIRKRHGVLEVSLREPCRFVPLVSH